MHVSTGADGEKIRELRREIKENGEVTTGFFGSDWDLVCRLVKSLVDLILASPRFFTLSEEDHALLAILRLTQEDFIARTN
jgi:hypothetical protein